MTRFIQIHGYSEHWFGVSKYGFQPWTAWSTGLLFYLLVTSSLFADLALPSSFIFMSEDSLRDEYVLCVPDLPIFTHVTQRRPGNSLGAQEISPFSHQVFQTPLCSTASLESSHPIAGDYSNVHNFSYYPDSSMYYGPWHPKELCGYKDPLCYQDFFFPYLLPARQRNIWFPFSVLNILSSWHP